MGSNPTPRTIVSMLPSPLVVGGVVWGCFRGFLVVWGVFLGVFVSRLLLNGP